MEIEKTTYMNTLYDFYGELLTTKQRDYLELYYGDNFSLGEIAQELSVSRQAVYDNIKRSQVILEKYEQTLQLVANFQYQQAQINVLQNYIKKMYPNDAQLSLLVKNLNNEE